MLTPCGYCLGAINESDFSVQCAGVCNRRYHISCVNISDDVYEHLISIPGLSWKCADCNKKCFSIDQPSLHNLLEQKYTEMLDNLNTVFADLKTNFLKVAESKLSAPAQEAPKYSEIIKNKTQPAVIVKPKNTEQSTTKTKMDINRNINTVDSNLKVSKVKNVKNGGILLGFSSKEENLRFKKLASDKLSENYDIKEVKGVQPRIKIVGMTEMYNAEEIIEYIEHAVRNNCTSINLSIDCSLIKSFPTKKNPKVYQALIQLDKNSYDTLIKVGDLFIGYDHCYIFDAVEIMRCYNCNGFHHSSKHCSNQKSCPKCGVSEKLDHSHSDCKAEYLKCVNCMKAINNDKELLDANHGAWDLSCPVYLREVEKFKKSLLLKQ